MAYRKQYRRPNYLVFRTLPLKTARSEIATRDLGRYRDVSDGEAAPKGPRALEVFHGKLHVLVQRHRLPKPHTHTPAFDLRLDVFPGMHKTSLRRAMAPVADFGRVGEESQH